MLQSVWRFFRPIAMNGARTLLKAGGEAIKDGSTVKEVLTNTLSQLLAPCWPQQPSR